MYSEHICLCSEFCGAKLGNVILMAKFLTKYLSRNDEFFVFAVFARFFCSCLTKDNRLSKY